MIVAHVGVIGSGKDWRAERLLETGKFDRFDFKDPLIDFCSEIVGWDVRGDYDWFKDMPLGCRRPSNPLLESAMREAARELRGVITGRQLLQNLGMAMRAREPNHWSDAWKDRVVKHWCSSVALVTCADLRFENEYRAAKDMAHGHGVEAQFIFCDYRSKRYQPDVDHPSEHLAQTLLAMGLKDGDEITDQQFARAFSLMARRRS